MHLGTYRGDIYKSGIKHQYAIYFRIKKPKYLIHLIPLPLTTAYRAASTAVIHPYPYLSPGVI